MDRQTDRVFLLELDVEELFARNIEWNYIKSILQCQIHYHSQDVGF